MNRCLKAALATDGRPAWRIAILAKLSPTILSRITVGMRRTTLDERARLANVLGKPVSELFAPMSAVAEAA